jgi:hypothetical protein
LTRIIGSTVLTGWATLLKSDSNLFIHCSISKVFQMTVRICLFVLLAIGFCLTGRTAQAHEIFQEVMKEQYMLRSFSCKACHPNNDDRKELTEFAKRIHKELEPLDLTEKYAAAVKAEEAAKAKNPDSVGKTKGPIYEFEQSIVDDFKKAFKVVGQQKMTIDEILKQGLFNGARLDTKKIEAARKEEKE